MDMDNLYRRDDQKMVGSKEILFYSKTRRGIIFEVVAYWLEKFKGSKVFILGIALYHQKSYQVYLGYISNFWNL